MKKRNEDGYALVMVMLLAIALAGLSMLISERSVSEHQQTTGYVAYTKATEAAEAGLDLAVGVLWENYLATDPAGDGTSGTAIDFLGYLDNLVPNGNAAPQPLVGTTNLGNGTNIQSVQVSRVDDPLGSSITVTSIGASQGVQRTVSQEFRVGGQEFGGFEYALLANNVNCLMCHASFDNIDRVLNTDPNLQNSFERVKIASLETLMFRHDPNLSINSGWNADSKLAGTVYTRGSIFKVSSNLTETPLSTLAGTTFTGFEFDPNTGAIVEDQNGNLTSTSLDLASINSETGLYDPMGNLYTDYPENKAGMTDGNLPTNFPSVVPDENGDRSIDDTEWANMLSSFTSDNSLGSITGGIRYGVDNGSSYSGGNLPSSSNSAASTALQNGAYSGNTFLIGTDANPIVINGKVAIDGDVVLKGVIKGTGQLYSRGNMYIVGDVTYADGTEYGVAADGTQNLVAYAAGGNIMIGDYLSKPFLSYNSSYYKNSYGNVPPPTMNSGTFMNFTEMQVAMFNREEVKKAIADPNYTPRIYKIRENDTAYYLNVEGEPRYFNGQVKSLSAGQLAAANAAVSVFSPDQGWMSDLFLKKIWYDDNFSRPSSGRALTVDGLLYTDRAIIAVAKGYNRGARFDGEFNIRGAMVTADLGVLGTARTSTGTGKGLRLQWDQRTASFLSIVDIRNLVLTRGLRVYS